MLIGVFNLFTGDQVDTSKTHQFNEDTFLDTLSCEQDMPEVIFINTKSLFNGCYWRSSESFYTESSNGLLCLLPTKFNELLLLNVTEGIKELFGLVRCWADVEGNTDGGAVLLDRGRASYAVAVGY